MECLKESIAYCANKTSDQLSDIPHFEKSWRNAPTNSAMNYEDFIDDDNKNKDSILQELRDTAACGVL